MNYDELVDKVAARTSGTASDPLARSEVEQVVKATLAELHGHAVATEVPLDEVFGEIDPALNEVTAPE